MSFNFMAAVTICSDFGAQKNKVSPRLIRQEGKGKEKEDKEKGKLYEQDRQREER